jgi:hypothetical protein
MRILYCYTRPHPRSVASIEAFGGPHVEYVGVLGDLLGYWKAIRERWTGAEALMVIEHDIEIHEGTVRSFLECGQPWCAFAYEMSAPGNWTARALGCTRYSAEAQRMAPADVIEAVPHSCSRCDGKPGCWAHLDGQIAEALETAGITVHEHRPPVTHWNKAIRS